MSSKQTKALKCPFMFLELAYWSITTNSHCNWTLLGTQVLFVIDAYSKWLETLLILTTTSNETSETPAELFLWWPITTRLGQLKLNLEDNLIKSKNRRRDFMTMLHGHKMSEFILGKDVLVENLRSTIPNCPKWITGKIIANTGGIIHRRHVD